MSASFQPMSVSAAAAAAAATTDLRIVEVKDKKELKNFMALPDKIYSQMKEFIKPLNVHTEMMLGPLNEAKKHILLAKRGSVAVARLAVKVHPHGPGRWLHFGFFECLPGETQATTALFNYAHNLYPDHALKGPFHFRMEDPYVGTLAMGFEQTPYVFMPYNPPYYDEYIQAAGLGKAIDLYTYDFDVTQCPEQISKIAQRAYRRGTSIRWLDPKKLKKEVRLVADIFNDALSENWGFEPITDEQLGEMFLIFKYFIDPRMVCFTVKDGREIGCLIVLPNLNPLIRTANGRLSLPFVWRLLRNRRKYDTARGYAMGMRKGHEGSGNVCPLIDAMYERAVKEIGLKHVEISWVLENNRPMTEMSQSIGGKHNKTYRVYEKPPLIDQEIWRTAVTKPTEHHV